jgi:hypothetical protein
MALGADGSKVLWMILGDALLMVIVGAIAGIASALSLMRYA